MIFTVTLNDEEGPYCCLDEEAKRLTESIPGLDDEERQLIRGAKRDRLNEFASKWISVGGSLTVEFDTTKGTCVVVEQ